LLLHIETSSSSSVFPNGSKASHPFSNNSFTPKFMMIQRRNEVPAFIKVTQRNARQTAGTERNETMTTVPPHQAGTPLPKSSSQRVFLVVFGMLQITLGAGLIVGWAGIAGSMLLASAGSILSLDDLTALYGFAASANYISPLFLGTVLDKFGPRSCSSLANGLVALGCFFFASADSFTTFAVGLCCIGLGGPGVQTSLIHLGNLFPTHRFFVMGMVAETITLSFAIFPLMDVIWANTNLSFREIFRGLGMLLVCSTIGSVLLWPDAPYEVVDIISNADVPAEICTNGQDEQEKLVTAKKPMALSSADNKLVDLQHQSFQEQISSGVYIRLSLFFLVTSFWANFYIATVTTEVSITECWFTCTNSLLGHFLLFFLSPLLVHSAGRPAPV
jgi:MFS family permease